MSTFKPGDRVRINFPFSLHHGAEATVLSPLAWLKCKYLDGSIRAQFVHDVSVDGVGTIGFLGLPLAFPPENLEPLTRPGLSAEQAKFVKDLQDSLSDLVKPGEIVEHGDVESAHA